jgi:hypothetical protein
MSNRYYSSILIKAWQIHTTYMHQNSHIHTDMCAYKGERTDLLVGIELVGCWFISPHPHTDPYMFLWGPRTLNYLPWVWRGI